VPLDVLDVVQSGSERVVDVDDDDLPVGLTLVQEGHDSEDLDLPEKTSVETRVRLRPLCKDLALQRGDLNSLDLTDVSDGLSDLANVERVVVTLGLGLGVLLVGVLPGLGESTVVPDVTVVGETVPHESELSLLDVLLDGVEGFLLGDLHLGVGPSGNLDDHVQDGLGLVGEEGDVTARRRRCACQPIGRLVEKVTTRLAGRQRWAFRSSR
jgi:hypothetical protein